MRFSMRPEPAAALMEEAVEATRGYAASLDVTIRLTPPVPGLTLNVDRDRFIQVLNNFLSNAVKASPGHSAIELRAEAHEGRARILVRNAGAGNATKFQDQALNAFSLTDTSSQRKRGAAGAGLHISRQIIEHMGGRIGFDSGAGPGMTMWVEMPAARVEMPASTAEAAVAPQADGAMPAEPGPRVLVCEDDDRVAWLIQKMLTKQGFAADVVHSIPEARRQLKNANYAAMTLDLALPSGNGMDFARELSDDAELSQLPIVIVSGTEPASWLELEAKSGVVDWIVKPINRQLLVASVAKAAAAYQLNAD
jgi:CheY-like chemotaxis protein